MLVAAFDTEQAFFRNPSNLRIEAQGPALALLNVIRSKGFEVIL
jgi:hypothetical protein